MSESLYGLLVAVAVLAALRFLDAPSATRAALLGAAIGLAALTRSEGLFLLVLLVPFVVRRAAVLPLRHFLIAVGAAALVVLPWSIRTSLVFHRPVAISNGDGAVLAGANTHSTYYRPEVRGVGNRALRAPCAPGE